MNKLILFLLTIGMFSCDVSIPTPEINTPNAPNLDLKDDEIEGLSETEVTIYIDRLQEQAEEPSYCTVDGDGSSISSPLRITSYNDLNTHLVTDYATNYEKHFVLTNNIVLPAGRFTSSIGGANGNEKFKGSFDGCEHTISRAETDTTKIEGSGFFKVSEGIIRNLTLNNIDINLDKEAAKKGTFIGGLVGKTIKGAKIINCGVVGGEISGKAEHIGGLVGINYATIKRSYSKNTITTDGQFGDDVNSINIGGLIGYNTGKPKSSVFNSYATGNVTHTGTFEVIDGKVINIGGLIGIIFGVRSAIRYSYATGVVSIDYTGTTNKGGLVGRTLAIRLRNNYFKKQGDLQGVGQVSDGSGTNEGAESKTDEEMRSQDTYVDWDETKWEFTGSEYPTHKN